MRWVIMNWLIPEFSFGRVVDIRLWFERRERALRRFRQTERFLRDARLGTRMFLFAAVCRLQSPQLFRLPRKRYPLPSKSKIDFVRDVEPILHTKCYECHGSGMQMNGLRFDQKEAALKGGYSGPAIVVGGSDKSPLILRVASAKDGFKMPPAGPALTAREIGVLRAWIDQGAPWPDVPQAAAGQKLSQSERRSHWSFQPVKRPDEPAVRQRSWGRNSIDSFILARLESEGYCPLSRGGQSHAAATS